MQIEGKNAVAEALASGRGLERLCVSRSMKGASAQALIDAARAQGIRVDFLDPARLDRMSRTGEHRGWIAIAADFAYSALDDLPDGLLLALDGIEDPHNLGAIVRVAECGGADGIVLPERRCVGVNETVVRVAAGATAHVRIARVGNLNDALRTLKARGMRIVGAELGGGPLWQADLTGPLVLVVGSEGHGLHRLTRELCDAVVTIPMFGKVNSLNASVAAGIVLYEALRRRAGGGA